MTRKLAAPTRWHPAAELFPMLSEAELADLAEDIVQNGQHDPIEVDRDGVGIDGRNRLAACRLAEVEPRIALYTGDDATAYIIGKNVRRRHLTDGQRAMAVVQAELLTVNNSADNHHTRTQQELADAAGLKRPHLRAAKTDMDVVYASIQAVAAANPSWQINVQAMYQRMRKAAGI